MGAMPLVVVAAAALAMVGAIFGVTLARAVWADDLRHATEMRLLWQKTEGHMKEQIAAQERELAVYRKK